MKKFYLSFLTITLVINMIIPLSIPVHAATEESAEWSDSKAPRTMTKYEGTEPDDVPAVAEQKIPIKETGMTAQEAKPIEKNEIAQNGAMTYNDYFPDDNLALVVAETRSANASDEVTPEELAQITSLSAYSKGIKDATGIEYLTGLEELDLSENELTNIDVSSNGALTGLYLSSNQLTSIDVSSNVALTQISVSYNQLTSIDVSNNVALTRLYLYNNQLTSIDVSSNVALEYLDVSYNQLSSIDVSSNVALTQISVSYNQLSSIDVSSNVALKWINVSSNQLTSIDISKNTALTNLYLSYNQLTGIDVSNNKVLEYLNIYKNQLTSIDVSSNVAILNFEVQGNKIRDISTIPDNVNYYYAVGQELEEAVQVPHQSTLVYTVPNDILDKNGDLVQTIHPENGGVYDAMTRTITWENLADKGEVTYTFASDDGQFAGTVTVPYAEKEAISIVSDDEISYEEEISKTEADFLTDIHASVFPASETLTSNFTDVVDLMTPGDYKVTLSVVGSDITKEVTVHVLAKVAPTITLTSDDEISYEEEISKTEADFLTDIHASVSPASETLTSDFTNVVDLTTPGDYKVTLSVVGSDITKEVTVHVTKKSSEDTPVPPKDDTNENGKDNGQTSENNQVKVTENELPKTGDSNHMLLGIFMLFIALLVIKIPKKTYREDAE
ncbi:TPA_asm: LapB repeat-containing protein [Listeria monocytogenes]|nr:LapB repeat-containing protein [Listeria monocytogenes]